MLHAVWPRAILAGLLLSLSLSFVSSSAFAAPPEDTDGAADEPHLALGAGSHVAFGPTPAIALGAHVSAELVTRVWSLGLEGRYDLSTSDVRTLQGQAVRTKLAGGSFVPCLRARGLWACGVVLASRVTSDGAEAINARFFLGIGARFELHLALPSDFALRLCGELLTHPFAYELVANGHRVFRSSILSTMIGPSLVHAF